MVVEGGVKIVWCGGRGKGVIGIKSVWCGRGRGVESVWCGGILTSSAWKEVKEVMSSQLCLFVRKKGFLKMDRTEDVLAL